MEVDTSSQILREILACEDDWCFRRRNLSEDARWQKFASFQMLVLCLKKQAMNMPEEKLNKRWNDHIEQNSESTGRIDGEQIQFVFRMFPGKKRQTKKCSKSMNGCDKVKEKMDNILLQKTALTRVLIMGPMNEIPISSKRPKGRYSAFLWKTRKVIVANFGKWKPGFYLYIGPGSEEIWKFAKYPDDPKIKWDELATDVFLVQKLPILKGCINFQKGKLKRGGENIHFDASDPSIKMLMDLISPANEFCIVYGMCD